MAGGNGSKAVRRNISQRSELLHDLHEYGLNVDMREIYLHSYDGNVDEEPGVEYRMSTKFVKNLDLLNSISSNAIITVKMHVTGGYWEDGMAIFDAIVASPSKVVIIAYAHATSMSSIILQAADVRVLMPNTHVMVHEGSDGLYGSVRTVISWAEWAKRIYKDMIDIYAERAQYGEYFHGRSVKVVAKFFHNKFGQKGDWVMDAVEAVNYGLADGVYGQKGFESIAAVRKKRSSKLVN